MTPPADIDTTPHALAQDQQPPRDDDNPIMFLEQEQFVSDRSVPVPPARLSRRTKAALWLLRIFAVIVSAMVYTFLSQLH